MSWVCWIFNLQAVNPQSMPLGFSWLVCVCVLVLSTQPAGAPETVTVEFLLVGLRGYQFPLVNSSGYLPVNISGVLDQDLFSRSLRNVSALYPGIFKGRVYISRATRNKTVVTSHRCSAGYFSPAGVGVCTICPTGTFSDGVDLGSCVPCPAGKFGKYPGGVGEGTSCFPCPTGKFGISAGGVGEASCVPCPAGKFGTFPGGAGEAFSCFPCPPGKFGIYPGSIGEASSCVPCPANTSSGVLAASTPSTCVPCPFNGTSPAGSTSQTACVSPIPIPGPDQSQPTDPLIPIVAGTSAGVFAISLVVGCFLYSRFHGTSNTLKAGARAGLLAVKIVRSGPAGWDYLLDPNRGNRVKSVKVG